MGLLDNFLHKSKSTPDKGKKTTETKNGMSVPCNDIVESLDCEYVLLKNEGDTAKIFDTWKELYRQGVGSEDGDEKGEGFFPLIIVPDESLAESFKMWDSYEEGILNEASGVNVDSFLKERLEDCEADESPLSDWLGEEGDAESESEPETQVGFSGSIEYDNSPYPELIIAKIPAENPWELPAWVPMGGFNDCPVPYEQVAVFKRWNEKYGAVPGLVTSAVWEFYVESPPETDEEALALAMEQYAFCGDIVWQGLGTIRDLAKSLKNCNMWFFWWD
ncbi:MAG: DUF4253 domain-containing protein [Oscillospiraceae bacterium]|nr:DUF4253 domain-containing protein [Oscillospiraceae bacterium]